ncbi:MAG: bifunctional folylpolyglutamate synthase/dihydrofolate synthase [Hyphomicrobiales bacterium]|nr:bifunctional folylpolyglutamate synthase/dihydrofolate synthase [Hyphomicrobiales bacterium]
MTASQAALTDILNRFERLHPKVIDLSLGRINRLLEALGDPHKSLPSVIHVAGTNGKGSVIAYLRAILEAAGQRVHVFTSPHLRRFNERIQLAGKTGAEPISDHDLMDVLTRAEAANDGEPITFFEITTAAAFLAFAEKPADFVLLETGLGGRLDATNVIEHPKLTAITPISIDHTNFLGETTSVIAGEKAGILKSGSPCIVAAQPDDVLAVIEQKAYEVKAPLIAAGQQWDVYEQHGRLVFQDGHELVDLPLPRLNGNHQIGNAGTAIAIARALDNVEIDESHLEQGLAKVCWPGRLEMLSQGPLHEYAPLCSEIWLDGGHNPGAAEVLSQSMADLEDRVPRPLFLIVGMMSTKDASHFLDYFENLVSYIVTVAIPDQPNAYTSDELCAIARHKGFVAEPANSIEDALELCSQEAEDPVRILITGSLYLAGHILDLQEHGLEA